MSKYGNLRDQEDGYTFHSRASTRRLTVTLALPDRRLCGNGYAGKYQRSRLVKDAREAAANARREALLDALGCARLHRDPLARTMLVEVYERQLTDGWRYFPRGVRVRATAHVRRAPEWSARKLDDDNFWRGMKHARDGLQDAGIVINDGQIVLGDVTWETAPPFRGEVVLTLIEED